MIASMNRQTFRLDDGKLSLSLSLHTSQMKRGGRMSNAPVILLQVRLSNEPLVLNQSICDSSRQLDELASCTAAVRILDVTCGWQ